MLSIYTCKYCAFWSFFKRRVDKHIADNHYALHRKRYIRNCKHPDFVEYVELKNNTDEKFNKIINDFQEHKK